MMNQFALHVRKSSFVRINRHPWLRRWGVGRAEERCVFLCGPYFSASAQACHENSCAPSCPDSRAVAVAQGVDATFLAVPESFRTKQSLFVSVLKLIWFAKQPKRIWQGPFAQAC